MYQPSQHFKLKENHTMRRVLTSESVSEGHPDKVCDQISDAILDACLMQDSESRVACETLATTNFIMLAGEITTRAEFDREQLARGIVAKIGYTDPSMNFSAESARFMDLIHKQSEDISMGVTANAEQGKLQGAGDQGMMFGYACKETPAFMPAPIYYAHRIVERFAQLRHSDPSTYWYLRPDAKSQVSFVYEDGAPVSVESIVLSHQHHPDMQRDVLERLVRQVVKEVLPAEYYSENIHYFINPTGNFVIGGPDGDCGLTGRKIIVDTYGGIGRHGGGAFSGKDPSKVDRSAAYMARYVVKNIVASGLASRCELQVSYAIGKAEPVSLSVDTFGTGSISDEAISSLVLNGGIFDFTPAGIIETLGLKHPDTWKYVDTATYGHFGKDGFPWEKIDKADILRQKA